VFGLKLYDCPASEDGATVSLLFDPPPPQPAKNPVNANPAANAATLQSFPVLMSNPLPFGFS
jgi:hypothetical protein